VEGGAVSVRILLTWAEVVVAAQVGCMRNIQSLRANRPPGNGLGVDNTWTVNIEGAAGEMAAAKHLGVFWSGAIGDLKADDAGPYQVKTNTSRKFDDLILRHTDADDRYYLLVLSFLPEFELCGWIYGKDGKQAKWLRDGTPGRTAFFVPRAALHPLHSLPFFNSERAVA
jgi:hypothetical protein